MWVDMTPAFVSGRGVNRLFVSQARLVCSVNFVCLVGGFSQVQRFVWGLIPKRKKKKMHRRCRHVSKLDVVPALKTWTYSSGSHMQNVSFPLWQYLSEKLLSKTLHWTSIWKNDKANTWCHILLSGHKPGLGRRSLVFSWSVECKHSYSWEVDIGTNKLFSQR